MVYLLIGIGAFFGAISRFLLSSFLSKLIFLGFPIGNPKKINFERNELRRNLEIAPKKAPIPISR